MSLATFEHQDVERFTHDFESLFNAGDAAGMAAFYADDARLLAEDTEPVRGREAIERFWRAACDQARAAQARRSVRLQEVTSSGDLGYALGTVVIEIPGREITTRYATIWRLGADHRWRLAVDISNREPATPPGG
jgi:uncharacterized protein (TIGR02246 family)